MLKLVVELLDPKFLTTVFAAVAAAATVLTLAMPYMVNDTLSKRMKAVAFEREKIRQRERERLAQGSKVALRQSPRAYMKTIVDNFNLSKWVGEEQAHTMLLQAGYRGQAPYITYLFFRMVMPVVMLVLSLFYVFVLIQLNPLTYAIDALRGVFIHFHQFDPRLGPAVLVVMAAVFFLVALSDFRRT